MTVIRSTVLEGATRKRHAIATHDGSLPSLEFEPYSIEGRLQQMNVARGKFDER